MHYIYGLPEELPTTVAVPLPPGNQVLDLAPGTSTVRADRLMPELRNWSWKYNPNLVGKDQFPPGVINDGEYVDLARGVESDYQKWRNTQWAWWYNLNLIGQDKLVPGKQYTERPPPLVFYRSWELNLVYNLPPLITPPGKSFFDLPPRDYNRFRPLRTWTWNYNPNLIGKDKLTTGKQIYDLSPSGRESDYQKWRNTQWAWWYNLNLIGKDKLTTGKQVYDLSPSGKESDYQKWRNTQWSWWYNLNLIGKDKLTTGKQVYDLTPQAPPRLEQSWIISLVNSTLGIPGVIPPGENIYDLPPRDYFRFRPLRTWIWNYNLNLIGQDNLGIRHLYRVPPRVNWYRDWSQNLVLITPTTVAAPFAQYDWPNPRGYSPLTPSWYWNYNLNLIGQDKLPVGENVYDLTQRPYFYAYDLRSWYWSYNKNLIGQDQLPVGEASYDLTQRPYEVSPRRSWEYKYLLTLIGQDKLPVGKNIYDLTQRPYEVSPRRSWEYKYLFTLIGQDQLPTGEQIYETPDPTKPARERRSWTYGYLLTLIGQDQMVTGEQVYDLTPAMQRGAQPLLQTWLFPTSIGLLVSLNTPPTATRYYDTPDPFRDTRERRSWTWSYFLTLIGKDTMTAAFRKEVYELPPVYYVPKPITQQNTWTWAYNLNLIGKDRLPNRQQDWPNPTLRKLPPADLYTWVLDLLQSTLTPKFPFAQYDWPLPGTWQVMQLRPIQTFYLPTFPPLIPVQKNPFAQYDWPLAKAWAELRLRPLQSFYNFPFIPIIPGPPTPTVIMSPADLSLIQNQEFAFYTPDDILTPKTKHIYLDVQQDLTPFSNKQVIFQRPDGSTFTANTEIGIVNLLTPKGLFIANQYLVYTVPIDKFYFPGAWRAFWVFSGVGASFYVEQRVH